MRKQLKILLQAAAVFGTIACSATFEKTASAAESAVAYSAPQIRLPLMTSSPTIDGTINEEEWSGANRMERFGRSAALSPQQASFWVGADAQNLYIAVRTETPPNGNVLKRANPLPGEADAQSHKDDSIEVYLSPNPDAPAAERRVYQGIFNAKDAIYDQLFEGSGGKAWRGDWKIKSTIADDHWDFEAALPWESVVAQFADSLLG